jgi:hypothetical protein
VIGYIGFTLVCGRRSSDVFECHVADCAGMMELADIDVSKASAREGVRVRIPLPAHILHFVTWLWGCQKCQWHEGEYGHVPSCDG